MTYERMLELKQNPEIQELFMANMQDEMQRHKKSEANNFRMLNCHAKKRTDCICRIFINGVVPHRRNAVDARS